MWTSNPVESNHVFFIVFILRNLPLLCFFSLTFLRFLRYVIFRCAKFSPQFLFFFYLINKQLLSIFFVVVDFFTLIELNWNGWCNTVMPFFFYWIITIFDYFTRLFETVAMRYTNDANYANDANFSVLVIHLFFVRLPVLSSVLITRPSRIVSLSRSDALNYIIFYLTNSLN